MISKEDIGFNYEIQENISIEDLRKQYCDWIIIWMNGSGISPVNNAGVYRCVLEFKGNNKYIEGKLQAASANRAMVYGAINAVECVSKPIPLYIVCATHLGFDGAFKGKGPNADLLQELFELVNQKGCSITEVFCPSGAELIKKYVCSCNPDQKQPKVKKNKEDYRDEYKRHLYRECLAKVKNVLEDAGVDKGIIDRVMEITP